MARVHKGWLARLMRRSTSRSSKFGNVKAKIPVDIVS